jgi:hypothetical protein
LSLPVGGVSTMLARPLAVFSAFAGGAATSGGAGIVAGAADDAAAVAVADTVALVGSGAAFLRQPNATMRIKSNDEMRFIVRRLCEMPTTLNSHLSDTAGARTSSGH